MEDKTMSFELNPLNNYNPQIRTNRTQDGGAGNTGYFQQNGNGKKKERDKSVFGEAKDTVTLSDASKFDYSDTPPLLMLVEFFKSLFRRLLHQ